VKVFISVDMEGISGLVRWADVATRGQDYPINRSILTADANAAIEGAFAGGAEEVVVEENHGVEDLTNLRMDEIDPRVRVIRGAGRPTATTMAGLDAETGVVLLVGHHARAGSFPGIMAHTVSYQSFRAVRVGGVDCGESELFAMRAGELGVPVGMVSGDQVVGDQLRKRAPWVEAVEVKRALSVQAGDVIPPRRAQPLIRAAAERAVRRARAGELPAYVEERAPWQIEVVLREPPGAGLAKNLAALPEFERDADGVTIRTEAPDMDLGFRRIAYLSYGEREGLLRY
jgi:D-amino peptidase